MTSHIPSAVPRPKLGSIARGASATLVASIVSMTAAVVINILVARALGPEIKGRIDLMMATGALASIVFGFSLTSGITYTVAQGHVNHWRLIWQLIGIALVQAVAAWVSLVFLSRTNFANAFMPSEYSRWGSAAIAFLTFASLAGGYWRAILAGFQRFVIVAGLDIVARLLTIIATVVVLLWFEMDHDLAAVGIILSAIIASYLVAIITMISLKPVREPSEPSSKLDRVWKYSLPSFAGNLVQFANYRLDIFLVAYYIGVREVALYSVAVSIAQVLWLPSNAMQSILFPRISGMTHDYLKGQESAQIMRLILAITLLAGAILGLMAPGIIRLLFGERFTQSLLPFWFLLPGFVIFCIANVLCGYLAGIGKPQLNFRVSLVGLLVTLLLDFALIPRLGMIGAAIASSVSYSISAVVALYFFLRESNLSLSRSLWLNKDDVRLAMHVVQGAIHQISSKLES